MTTVSVVLVTYQSQDCLNACLASLRTAARACWGLEVILVDNASTDGTWSQIEAFAASEASEASEADSALFRTVRILRLEENRGYAFANNRGIEMASGEAVLLLNPDTEVTPEAIPVCLERLTGARGSAGASGASGSTGATDGEPRRGTLGAVGCRLVLPDGRLDRAAKRSFPTLWNSFCKFSGLAALWPRSHVFGAYNLTWVPERASLEVDCVCGAFMMVTRDVVQQTGGFDEEYFLYGEDIDWCYRIREAGYRIWYEGSVTTLHRKGGNGGKRSAASLTHFYGTMALFFEKHYGNRYPAWVLRLVRRATRVMCAVHVALLRG